MKLVAGQVYDFVAKFPAYMPKLNVIMTKPDVTQHIFQILR